MANKRDTLYVSLFTSLFANNNNNNNSSNGTSAATKGSGWKKVNLERLKRIYMSMTLVMVIPIPYIVCRWASCWTRYAGCVCLCMRDTHNTHRKLGIVATPNACKNKHHSFRAHTERIQNGLYPDMDPIKGRFIQM